MQVVMELLAGLVFCMWAALTGPGKFLSILPYSEENRYLILGFFIFCISILHLILANLSKVVGLQPSIFLYV